MIAPLIAQVLVSKGLLENAQDKANGFGVRANSLPTYCEERPRLIKSIEALTGVLSMIRNQLADKGDLKTGVLTPIFEETMCQLEEVEEELKALEKAPGRN
jgi:hypothetical protein